MYITRCKIDDQCKFNILSRSLEAGALGQPRGSWEKKKPEKVMVKCICNTQS